MRLPATLLSLTLLAIAPLGARWDDPSAGMPVLLKPPAHESADPYFLSAVEDGTGRLYCSADHIFEYNGESWSVIEVGKGNIVRALALDDSGRLWCGGINELGVIEADAQGIRTFTTLRDHLPADVGGFDIWNVFHRNGRTLYVESHAVYIWDGSRFTIHPLPTERRLYSFEFEGRVFVSQAGGGLWAWEDTRLVRDSILSTATTVQAAWRDTHGHIVYLASDRLIRIRDGVAESFAHELVGRIRPHRISQAAKLPDGHIAFLTVTAGILIANGETGEIVRQIDRRDGLPALYAAGLSPTANQHAWVTHGAGVLRLDLRHRQSLFTEASGIGGEGKRVVVDHDDTTWGLTADGVARLAPDPPRAASLQRVGTLHGHYNQLMCLDDGTVVLAGLREFLHLSQEGPMPLVESSLDFIDVVQLAPGRPQLAASEGSTVALLDLSMSEPRVGSLGGFPDFVARLAPAADGTLWTAFRRDGLVAVRPEAPTAPERRHLRPGVDLPVSFDDPALFSLGGEVFACTSRAIVALPRTPGDAPRVVQLGLGFYAVERSGDDAVWAVASAPGREPRLVRVTRGPGGSLTLRPTDQVIRSVGRITNINRTGDILWIGGFGGFVRIDTREIADERPPRPPIVQSVAWRIGERATRLALAGGVAVDFHRAGTLEIHLRAPDDPFAPVQLIETRLAGIDDRWRLTGRSRTIAGLDDGRHTLEARVVGLLGNPGPVVSYSFTITPPWFRTVWAYAGYILAFIGSLYGVAQWRTRRIRRQNLQLEQLVNRRTEELAQAVSARSAFLANMGHEIRNPLNGVVGLVGTLRARPLPPEQQGIVDRIGTCADQLISVIEDVLEYARVDAGRIALRKRPYVVREPVDAAIDIFRAAQPDATIELEADEAVLDGRIVGDPDRVRHILVNYLANALKFAGNTPVTVAVRRDGPLLVLAVTDRGPGLTAEEQSRLFVRFSRGSLAYKNAVPGTGLGLAACKAYAEAMGGDVSVESEPGAGATFFLRVPYQPAAADAAPPPVTSPDIMVGRHALVVDDQDFNRFVLTDLLGRMGASTTEAASIGQAREAFRVRVPDVVFVDFDLAGATGADLAEWIRHEAPAGRDVPIISTTAFEVDEVRRRCEEAGMDGFLAKPVTAQRLADVLAHIERVRSGGGTVQTPAPEAGTPTTPSSFLDILAGGDPDKRREIEHSTWREVLLEALAAHRALRRADATLTARHAHRLVSAALVLGHRDLVSTARELNAVAKAGDLALAVDVAARLRRHIRTARARRG